MSARNLRKVYGDNRLPPPNDSSDEDYQPLYAKTTSSKFTYQGLELSSDSEPDTGSVAPETIEETEADVQPAIKKNKKKKRKQRKRRQSATNATDEDLEDEIDKSIKEINALLGSPPLPSGSKDKSEQNFVPKVMVIQPKHINVSNELKRLFGDEPRTDKRRGNRRAALRYQKNCILVPSLESTHFPRVGLSMSMTRRDDGCIYFTFDHNSNYQRLQQNLLYSTAIGRTSIMTVEECQRTMHVECMLETADMLFRMEEYTAANTLIELAVAYMQSVAHPSFQLADPRTRLRYTYMENRPFHIAVLKYIHLLTNRACHRTALELAKMLMNLDPSDPLAVLLIIDTLALRAREHQWLIDAVNQWSSDRDAGFMFSIQYSYAMAQFHVAMKNNDDTTTADNLLQSAMLRFPSVAMKILECANIKPHPRIKSHPLFNSMEGERTTKNLQDLILLYSKLTWSKWREPGVIDWLKKNAHLIADKFDIDDATKKRAKELSNERVNLFRAFPSEVVRHLCIIKPMADLLVDGAVPHVTNLLAADPSPPSVGVNRYAYSFGPPAGRTGGSLRELFSSILPNYQLNPPPDYE